MPGENIAKKLEDVGLTAKVSHEAQKLARNVTDVRVSGFFSIQI